MTHYWKPLSFRGTFIPISGVDAGYQVGPQLELLAGSLHVAPSCVFSPRFLVGTAFQEHPKKAGWKLYHLLWHDITSAGVAYPPRFQGRKCQCRLPMEGESGSHCKGAWDGRSYNHLGKQSAPLPFHSSPFPFPSFFLPCASSSSSCFLFPLPQAFPRQAFLIFLSSVQFTLSICSKTGVRSRSR